MVDTSVSIKNGFLVSDAAVYKPENMDHAASTVDLVVTHFVPEKNTTK